MIEFIVKSITDVAGIKKLLLNDDYRNNFEWGRIPYPSAVLTPIPSITYSTKSLIRESFDLRLAIVDIAPRDYTGEQLYNIQKNCVELGLNIIRNLQEKMTLDDNIKFEMLLPNDIAECENLCGAMAVFRATAKQPRCI